MGIVGYQWGTAFPTKIPPLQRIEPQDLPLIEGKEVPLLI
jgi:hypothetical protein